MGFSFFRLFRRDDVPQPSTVAIKTAPPPSTAPAEPVKPAVNDDDGLEVGYVKFVCVLQGRRQEGGNPGFYGFARVAGRQGDVYFGHTTPGINCATAIEWTEGQQVRLKVVASERNVRKWQAASIVAV